LVYWQSVQELSHDVPGAVELAGQIFAGLARFRFRPLQGQTCGSLYIASPVLEPIS